MPDLIETRPFTIHPELLAWPSFRLYSERVVALYGILLLVLTFLLRAGLGMSWPIAALTALGLVGIAFGLSFRRYRTFLGKPETRQLYRNCVVSLTEDEVRQDFTDSSYMAIKLFAVKTFRDVGDFYFVFASKTHGIVVPKTSFESPEESREFAERLRRAAKSR